MKSPDLYVTQEPNGQNVFDLFQGEWSSHIPERFGYVAKPGTAGLFEDVRVAWAEEILGPFKGQQILELGPLEGGHSFMFQDRGAAKVTAIEANTRAYLKCLCVKEVFGLDRVEFKLGDFVAFLEKNSAKFDLVFGSGVLYHMVDPIGLIKLASKTADRLFLWTHYFDADVISKRPDLQQKFGPLESKQEGDIYYEYATQHYNEALNWAGFCGGPMQTSKWLTKESIFRALQWAGYGKVIVNFDQPDHQNGSAFALCATKQ